MFKSVLKPVVAVAKAAAPNTRPKKSIWFILVTGLGAVVGVWLKRLVDEEKDARAAEARRATERRQANNAAAAANNKVPQPATATGSRSTSVDKTVEAKEPANSQPENDDEPSEADQKPADTDSATGHSSNGPVRNRPVPSGGRQLPVSAAGQIPVAGR